ncbi:MAG: helix-turn-helix transcriptional regulator [Clostridia bacterium]|nr:helix-turn-helix transcriptional regulator [Clostridia bacterium]
MDISIKDTLRALRQSKNITQEALAKHLGITPQSVGKWERGEGFPDITLLPNIALYFGVTIDDLLDVGQVRIDAVIESYRRESRELLKVGNIRDNLALWERAYDEMPNECAVMDGLMSALLSYERYPLPREVLLRVIELGERVLRESTDTNLRSGVIQRLCYAYDDMGDKESALRYADMCGSMYTTRDDLRTTLLDGEEGIAECQQYIANLVRQAAMTSVTMTTKADFTLGEKVSAYDFGIALLTALYSDENVGFNGHNISWIYSLKAGEYAKVADGKNTLDALEQAAKYAILASTYEKMNYTAPMVNRLVCDPDKITKNYQGNTCNLRLSDMEWSCYDFIREDERFKIIEEDLHKHAE